MIKDIFDSAVTAELIDRINSLTANSTPQWGKMTVDQMLAHCDVAYAYTFNPEKFKKPNFVKRWLLKTFAKPMVVGPQPYKKGSPTAPIFLITDRKNFEKEKSELIDNIHKTQQLGRTYFEGKENISFGKLTANEWNTLFYKHLDHHLNQFGV